MDQTQDKPRRKRQRWLIVALLLVLVTGVAWWQWPRGDARFVGKWSIHPKDQSKAVGTFTFKSNGFGSLTLASETRSFPWFVEGNNFRYGFASGGILNPLVSWLSVRLRGTKYGFVYGDEEHFEIVDVANCEIRLRFPDAGHEDIQVLRRIPE